MQLTVMTKEDYKKESEKYSDRLKQNVYRFLVLNRVRPEVAKEYIEKAWKQKTWDIK